MTIKEQYKDAACSAADIVDAMAKRYQALGYSLEKSIELASSSQTIIFCKIVDHAEN